MSSFSPQQSLHQYLIVTGNYWAFTLIDGALRMLVVLYFHQLGYSPLAVAFLFLFYEFFGVVTNLVGGWLGARFGLNRTMNLGLALQIVALLMLTLPADCLSIAWVMAAQALSGIAKDLNKMSAKSSVKLLLKDNQQGALFKWVSLLTGSKNALKGAGFFLGGVLLATFGFQLSMWIMIFALTPILFSSLCCLQKDIGRCAFRPKFSDIFSKSKAINRLAAARLFLFSSRDVWFVVALPVFMVESLEWGESAVGAFLALWVIGYGVVQGISPLIVGGSKTATDSPPTAKNLLWWAMPLAATPGVIALAFQFYTPLWPLLIGLMIFAFIFALNSSLHSYLILSYAKRDGVSMDVGFYYMANAMGRLLGTIAGGYLFQHYGMQGCLWLSSGLLVLAVMMTATLNRVVSDRVGSKGVR